MAPLTIDEELGRHRASQSRDGEERSGKFGALCTREKIKQELTTADTPELNGVAERQITTIEATGLAARVQASGWYAKEAFPKGESLWAE